MEARKCIVCGTRHWPRQECPAMAEVIATERDQQHGKTKAKNAAPVVSTKPVTINPVTENTPGVTINTVTINTPVTRKRGRPPTGKAMTAAERMRKYRERKAMDTVVGVTQPSSV